MLIHLNTFGHVVNCSCYKDKYWLLTALGVCVALKSVPVHSHSETLKKTKHKKKGLSNKRTKKKSSRIHMLKK